MPTLSGEGINTHTQEGRNTSLVPPELKNKHRVRSFFSPKESIHRNKNRKQAGTELCQAQSKLTQIGRVVGKKFVESKIFLGQLYIFLVEKCFWVEKKFWI